MKDLLTEARKASQTDSVIKGMIPILWFGNLDEYKQSKVRIITVGLNPSGWEFRETQDGPFDISIRFREYDQDEGDDDSLIVALNAYFRENPYNWFKTGFEPVLNGMDASYYSDKGTNNIAIHTDICTPWATAPTWSRLSLSEKQRLFEAGFPLWKKLIRALTPDIILFSIPQQYIDCLKLSSSMEELYRFDNDKNGNKRNKPVIIRCGRYCDAVAIFGRTRNVPYGALGKNQKMKLGSVIRERQDENKVIM